MSNLPILWQNMLCCFGEDAGTMYLRGAARDEPKAFRMACEWEDRDLAKVTQAISRKWSDLAGEQHVIQATNPNAAAEVVEFIRERHFRKYFPDGRSA